VERHSDFRRLTTSASQVVHTGVLETVERAVSRLSEDPALKRQARAAYRELLRDIEPLALLLADAESVIKGDPAAAGRFEALLDRVAEAAEPSPADDTGLVKAHADKTPSSDEVPPADDSFVHLDSVMKVGVALGMLPVDEDRFSVLFDGLQSLADAVGQLQDFHEAALMLLRRGDPAPMHTLSWRPPAHRPKTGKPKPKPKRPKRPKRPIVKTKIKDTRHAWVSCFRGAAGRARAESGQAPKFTVLSVTPIDACPGWQITIGGTNFGTAGGTVAFRTPSGSPTDYLAVAPDSWSDTTIVVRVPDLAREGPLHIYAIDHVFIECHRKWPVYRLPNPAGPQNNAFFGGLPDVYDLSVNGRNASAHALPDSIATVSWVTTSGQVTIEVRNDADATEPHWKQELLLGGTGFTKWTIKPVSSPTKYVLALTVTNHCGPVTKELPVMVTVPAVVRIEGVEVTQGVQVFSLTGGPRNTLPTVADKDTIVRLYVSADRSGWFGNKLGHISAGLGIGGQSFQPINKAPAGSMTGGDPYLDLGGPAAIDREKTDASFNFRIPAAFCTGTKTFIVAVFGSDEIGPVFLNQHVTWTWQPKKAVRVRYVRVSYQGTMPTVAEAAFTLVRAFDLLPSPPLDIGPAWMPTWNTGQDLSTEDGKHTLLGHLSDQHNCTFSEWLFPWEDDCPDDDGAFWVGVIAKNVGGRARTGENTAWAASFGFDRVAAGHEIGHLLCLRHVNQGCNGNNPDESNSCGGGSKGFDSLPLAGQVVDVAFDPYNNAVVPAPRFDFMSYACQRWTSATNWDQLFSTI
jgi:hypothetical protein